MKKIANILLSFLLLLGVLLAVPISVSAASMETRDGLEISICTNEDVYSVDDYIQVDIMIKNTNSFDVTGVSLDTILPEKLELKNGEIKLTDINIKAGATYTTNIVAKHIGITNEEMPTSSGSNVVSGIPGTGDTFNVFLWVSIIVVSTVVMSTIIIFMVRRKKVIKVLGLFLLLAVFGIMNSAVIIHAEEPNVVSVTVEKLVEANNEKFIIKAIAKYSMSKTLTEVDEYYLENSEKIVSIDVVKEDNALSEKEVCTLMEERGFNQYPIVFEYDLEGNYVGEKNVRKDSDIKHPMYQTFYVTNNGDIWSVFVIGKKIIANPAYYNVSTDEEKQILIAEEGTLTSYDDESNQFYVTVPKSNIVELNKITKINAMTIDKIKF